MMKFKTIAVALVLVGLGAFGASLAAPQADSGKPASPVPTRLQAGRGEVEIQGPARPCHLENYVVEPPDLLIVEVLEALPGRPISGERLVRPDGKISLGFYGDVYVAGLTIPEVKEKIIRHLQKFLSDEALGLVDDRRRRRAGDRSRDQQAEVDRPERFRHGLRRRDGLQQQELLRSGRGPHSRSSCRSPAKRPILDVINLAGGLAPQADHKDVVLYRQPSKGGPLQALPVDIDQITMGDDLSTNYQLLPGDRLVVPRHAEVSSPMPAKSEAEQSEQPMPPRRSRPCSRISIVSLTSSSKSRPRQFGKRADQSRRP